jgi:Tat protein translocase TatB subunit
MFDLGVQELIVIFAVALIVFGPKRLPELAKAMGKGMAELRRSLQGVKEQIDEEIQEIENPVKEELKEVTEEFPRFDDLSKFDEMDEEIKKSEADKGEKGVDG